MAAPMKTARVGLSFDKYDIENSWFLVDFSTHTCIKDVASEIKECYFTSNNNESVVLRVNNFLLPPSGSAELFRENDVVSVRLENSAQKETQCTTPESGSTDSLSRKHVYSSNDGRSEEIRLSHSAMETPASSGHETKKRRHSETEINQECSDSRKKHKSSKHKRKKHREEQVSQAGLEHELPDTSEGYQKAKKGKEKDSNGKSEYRSKRTDPENACSPSGDSLPQDDGMESEISKTKKKKCREKSEQVKSSSLNIVSDLKVDHSSVAVSSETEKFTDTHTDEESLSSSGAPSNDTDGKKKRKRKRKRKRKSPLFVSSENKTDTTSDSHKPSINDVLQRYAGMEVDNNVTGLYGALPDKLEPPKYYRHGYRNLNTYEVEPNKHKRFGADLDPDKEENSTQQYNFLCKSRKISDTNLNGDAEISGSIEDDDQRGKLTGETSIRDETQSDQMMYSRNSSYISEIGISEQSEQFQGVSNDSIEFLEQDAHSSENQAFSAVPFNYADMSAQGNIRGNRTNIHSYTTGGISPVKTSPVTLERKTLTNGVSVFVRQRASPGSRFRELSKQEQLDTTATNVSAIYTNSPASEFKVPSSPAPKQKLSPKACIPTVKDSLMEKNLDTLNGTDLTNLKPLVGTPKPGDTIAYKVLEISASCTPEVSDYKIAKVLSVDDKQMLELNNLNRHDKQTNIFHVEIEDGDEILTNTEEEADVVWLHQSSLLQPGIVASDSP